MAFNFKNLDTKTREFMLQEMQYDVNRGALYLSERLNGEGAKKYPGLLTNAFASETEVQLADKIATLLNPTYKTKASKTGEAKMPSNAHTLLAEGEFNRFYIRALCLRALEDGLGYVIVYRAKEVIKPRPESVAKIGAKVDAQELLNDLRVNIAVDTALGLPPGPNSGLSVFI